MGRVVSAASIRNNMAIGIRVAGLFLGDDDEFRPPDLDGASTRIFSGHEAATSTQEDNGR